MAIENTPIPKCIVLEGDGGILMNPNALASAAFLNVKKWLLIILDNGCFDSTGGQRSVASTVDVGNVAKGFGLTVLTAEETEEFDRAIQMALAETEKPMVIHARIKPGNQPAPYINDDPVVFAHQFSRFIREHSQQ
jgi:thiamine pyrophosphate-dependent acetolactate synthase large subunit-like protein